MGRAVKVPPCGGSCAAESAESTGKSQSQTHFQRAAGENHGAAGTSGASYRSHESYPQNPSSFSCLLQRQRQGSGFAFPGGASWRVRDDATAPVVGDPTDPRGMAAMRDRYLEHIAVRNYSPRTIEGRTVYLNYFIKWCEDRAIVRPAT